MDSHAIALNFSEELDSTDCSMRVLEKIFKMMWFNQFKFLVLGNIKRVFRFAFTAQSIHANIFS